MVTRAQFLGGGALAVLAASMGSTTAQAADGSRLLIATDEGISNDGSTPVNSKINQLSKSLADNGGGAIVFPPGIYAVDDEGVEVRNQVSFIGLGEATQFMPTGTWGELAGVFRIGTDKENNSDPVYRSGLHDLSIKPGKDAIKHAESIENVVGVLYNTKNGDSPADPDAAHRISGLTLWDLDMGIKIKGADDQGMTVERIRGRKFLRSALVVGEAFKSGGADNMFSMIDLSSANRAKVDAATVELYTSNTSWSQVKTWYSKRSVALDGDSKAGAGFYIKGTRNTFSQCDAQDNGGHGFLIKYGNNSFVNCVADSNGHADNLEGSAKLGEAHGFHVSVDAPGTQLIGCQAFNRDVPNPGQGVGFWVAEGNKNIILSGNAFGNTSENSVTKGLDAQKNQVIDGGAK
ncbi:right-handed parallel beta-helix repeat-containing protein [Rothia terrae]|uniref:right-handed parallel beta-helix repeat-containing protein n=1 Tax=Rothia terrae TaxID=396015 RepID=UPI0033EFCB4F